MDSRAKPTDTGWWRPTVVRARLPARIFPRLLVPCLAFALVGCAATSMRSQSPEEIDLEAASARLVGDVAVPDGMQPVQVEAVALVTGLTGTGSDPQPGPERAALLDEMQKRGVANPNSLLATGSTSLVLVRGYLRAGIQKGDQFDIEVRVPSRSETTSLRNGWLMETRLREMAALGNQVREGHLLALAKGAVLVDPNAEEGEDGFRLTRGRVLGGGIALKSRPLRLVLKPDHRSARSSSQIETAVDRRFHTFNAGVKDGVATAKTDEYVELKLHPRYKANIARYMQVVRSVPLKESPAEQMERLKLLERQLLDPISADNAALRLEAIGKAGGDTLMRGVGSDDALVRFYAAEALAYLDDVRAVEPLAESAKDEPAFRVYALAALGAMDDFAAYQALRDLMDVPSAETRYGAFRALWTMNPDDDLVRGESLGDQFSYHRVPTAGPPMIHLTRSFRPEVVLFGDDHRLNTPVVLEASKHIMIKANSAAEVIVSRFNVGNDVQKRTVTNNVDEIIRAIVELGGSYPDVVQVLQQAKHKQALSSRLEVDALPQPGREYDANRDETDGQPGPRRPIVSNPLPDLFAPAGPKSSRTEEPEDQDEEEPSASSAGAPRPAKKKGFLARLAD